LWAKERQEKEKLRKRAKRAEAKKAKAILKGPGDAEHDSTPSQEPQEPQTEPANEPRRISLTDELAPCSSIVTDGNR
jgi:hypothetical protein